MDEEYLEAVLDLVAAIPPGRVMTYGTIADVIADALLAEGGRARGGPRQVGHVLARAGAGVPWWRVVNAGGRAAPGHLERAQRAWLAERTPLTAGGDRVAVRRAIWFPTDQS